MKAIYVVLTTLIIVCSIAGCQQSEQQTAKETVPSIVGAWKNIDLNVVMHTYKDMDTTVIYDVPEGSWEKMLGIKPIVTTFAIDGTYSSEYTNLQDSVIRNVKGTWSLQGDSLLMVEDSTTSSYHIILNNDVVTFKAYLDWDQDGKVDDLYEGRQRKMNSD